MQTPEFIPIFASQMLSSIRQNGNYQWLCATALINRAKDRSYKKMNLTNQI